MNNECVFSKDRAYRYTLLHRWNSQGPLIAWIGLNPSVANETQLDRTLSRIKAYSNAAGYSGFFMLNLFAFITPYPKIMKQQGANAIGTLNDWHIDLVSDQVECIVAAWGNGGSFLGRDEQVINRLAGKLHVLDLNKTGAPVHPLYQPSDLVIQKWK